MKKNIFEPSEDVRGNDYPHLLRYTNVIWEAFWTPEHFDYDRDVRDFKTKFKPHEQEAMKRSMLCIGVVENKVKTSWARIDIRLPKTEISDAGFVFAGNEVVHRRTYKQGLDLLGLEDVFQNVMDIPEIGGRIKYLNRYLEGYTSRSNKEFTKSLILFTLLVENASLFSNFLTISAFGKYKNMFTNFTAVVNATSKEEAIHAQFGAELIKIIREENPDWFDQDMEDKIRRNIRKAYKAEDVLIDWVFEKGELDFMPKNVIKEYTKQRLNHGLQLIGYDNEYVIDKELLKPTEYFDRMSKAPIAFDFFAQKSTDYNKTNLITEDAWD
jgi:ribonucleoside-diphosphate reductase beta chain